MDRITFNPEQCGERPCIRGMRIRVKDVLELLAAGLGEPEILADYPYLEAEDIPARLAYAAISLGGPFLEGREENRMIRLLRRVGQTGADVPPLPVRRMGQDLRAP